MKTNSLKNILLTLLVSSSISTAYAEIEYNKPYLLLEGGISKPSKKVTTDSDTDGYFTNYPTNKKFKKSSIWGIGAGYKVDDNFRMDLIVNYRPDFKYNSSDATSRSTYNYNQKLSNVSGMINAYYDIGNYSIFTPFIGGGVGISRTKVGNFNENVTDNNNIRTPSTFETKGHKSTNFAYQLTAGALVNIADNVDLKFAYKHSNLGKFRTNLSQIHKDENGAVALALDNPIKGKLIANEFVVGVQFKL